MKDLWSRIWNTEPVVFVGGLTAAWSAVVAFDQASDVFTLPVWTYIVAVPLIAGVTPMVRRKVTPTVK